MSNPEHVHLILQEVILVFLNQLPVRLFLSSHHFHPFLPASPHPVPPLQQYAWLLSASHVNEIVSRSKRLGEVFLITEEVLISVREGETSQRAGSFHYTPFLLGCVICMWEQARHSACTVGHIDSILYLQMFVSVYHQNVCDFPPGDRL